MIRLVPSSLVGCLLLVACAQEPSKEGIATATDTTLWAKYKTEGWKNHGCELISDGEIELLFAFDGKAATLNVRPLPNQAFCLRTWNKPDWKERETNNEKKGATWLNPQNRLVIQLLDYTSEEHARLQIENLRRDRRTTYEEDVSGLGDDALWSTSTVTLLVRKGQFVINLALEVNDVPHDNLNKAKEAAALALKKL
ncbi:MAG: hypothetical protein Q7T20_18125 [Saprospiraceae bacterium]|nr:hypothetical protein [Saprospiraceae bacterium]